MSSHVTHGELAVAHPNSILAAFLTDARFNENALVTPRAVLGEVLRCGETPTARRWRCGDVVRMLNCGDTEGVRSCADSGDEATFFIDPKLPKRVAARLTEPCRAKIRPLRSVCSTARNSAGVTQSVAPTLYECGRPRVLRKACSIASAT